MAAPFPAAAAAAARLIIMMALLLPLLTTTHALGTLSVAAVSASSILAFQPHSYGAKGDDGGVRIDTAVAKKAAATAPPGSMVGGQSCKCRYAFGSHEEAGWRAHFS